LSHQHLTPDRTIQPPKMVRKTIDYPSLTNALSLPAMVKAWKGKTKRDTKDLNPICFFSILAIWEFQARHKGELLSNIANVSAVKTELESIANDLISSTQVNDQVLRTMPMDVIESMVSSAGCEFPPTCAVVGGLLAQDILKALAAKETPYANVLTFDGLTGGGTVIRMGMD